LSWFLEYGIYCVLQDRIYLPGQPILYDHVLWKQCHNCVITVALFTRNMKQRWSLKNAVEPSNNPFDEGRIITGLGNKRKKYRHQNKFEKIKERIEKEKDEDVKRQLRKGNTVEIIEDGLDY
jgi:hypothetical protein